MLVDTMFEAQETKNRPFFLAGATADHQQLAQALTAEEAIVAAGQSWEVGERELRLPNGAVVPGYKAIVREDTGSVLSVRGANYERIQNSQLYKMGDALMHTPGGEGIRYASAGVFGGGRVVWALAEIPAHIRIKGDPSDIVPYIMLTTSHDGSRPFGGYAGAIRVRCWNTYQAAVREAVSSFAFRHTASWTGRVKDAQDALGLTFAYIERFEQVSNALAERPMSLDDVLRFTEVLIPNRKADSLEAPARTQNARNEIAALFSNSATLEGVDYTAYRTFQAVTEYVDHRRTYMTTKRNDADDNRGLSLMDGQGFDLKAKALNILIKAA